MRTFLNTERRRENKPEPREAKVEATTACGKVDDEQVVHATSCVCLETEIRAGESLVDEGRSLVVVGMDEECP